MKAPAPRRRDRLRAMLADLKMPGALEAVDGILAQADGGAISAAEAIERLLDAQIGLRNNRRLQAAMRSSRLPAVKTLEAFDFAFQPSIKREQIDSLHELGFVERAENVILLGPPGVGKTHLAISLAIAAAEAGRRVYYGTLAGLIESLTEAKAAGNLSRRLKVLTHPALLVVDEIGYLPVSQDGAVLFFQLINARHERASTVLTSNKGFEDWGGVLGDDVMAKRLTAAFVRTVTSPGKYHDEHGLLLRVVRSKKKQLISKSWVQRLVIHGRNRELGLGGYPNVSLAEARERALENRRIARSGGDPFAQRATAEMGRASPTAGRKRIGADGARGTDAVGNKPK